MLRLVLTWPPRRHLAGPGCKDRLPSSVRPPMGLRGRQSSPANESALVTVHLPGRCSVPMSFTFLFDLVIMCIQLDDAISTI